MGLIISISRIVLPILTVIIVTRCMLSLLLGHPSEKIYGYIVDMADGERHALGMWETSIGRSNLCDIVLGYNSVSRAHAVISRRIDGWYIFDLVSKASIQINGKKLEKSATIQNGDVISFGTASFKFLVSDDPVQAVGRKAKNAKTAKTVGPRPQPQRPQGQQTPPKPQSSSSSEAYYRQGQQNTYTDASGGYGTAQGQPFKQNSVPTTGKTGDPAIVNPQTGAIIVLRGNLVSIGRGNTCDLRLSDPSVSRKHASLVLYEDGWAIEDSGSTTGTYLNGQKVTSPQLLFDGDTITMGSTNLKFSVLSRTYN